MTSFSQQGVCAGITTTAPPDTAFTTFYLIWGILCSAYLIFGTMHFVYVRRSYPILRAYTTGPAIAGAILGPILILGRSITTYNGREFIPCNLNLLFVYGLIPFTCVWDILSIQHYMYKLQRLNEFQAKNLENEVNDQLAASKNGDSDSVAVYLSMGSKFKLWVDALYEFLFNYAISIKARRRGKSNATLLKPKTDIQNKFQNKKIVISTLEITGWILYTLPLVITYLLRVNVGLDSDAFKTCYGCQLLLFDLIFVGFYATFVSLPIYYYILFVIKSDVLMIRSDFLLVASVTGPFLVLAHVLAFADPSDLMKQQKVDWYLFEFVYITFYQFVRTHLRLWRVKRSEKEKQTQTIRLLDVLNDAKASRLFEAHLKAELAYENFQFWKAATKWKLSYDKGNSPSSKMQSKLKDAEYTQQMARVLFRTFLQKDSQLPINIPHKTAEELKQVFKSSKVIPRNVFDNCLYEVYRLMENGAFHRFMRTGQGLDFAKQFAKSQAGLSTSSVFSQLKSDNVRGSTSSIRSSAGLSLSVPTNAVFGDYPIGPQTPTARYAGIDEYIADL